VGPSVRQLVIRVARAVRSRIYGKPRALELVGGDGRTGPAGFTNGRLCAFAAMLSLGYFLARIFGSADPG
jgi:hypothetical protein